MSYFKPYIDETGYHYPTYNEILEALVESVQGIYGTGVYLGNDSPDYELLSIMAEKMFDVYQTVEIDYDSKSPVTAMGTNLDIIVALNGIARKVGKRSRATLTLTGAPNTVIQNGVAADVAGVSWDLPEEVVIGSGGTVTVEATCRDYGLITAEPNTITIIMTPVAGWISVTNNESATVGTAVETDSELRGRQAWSVALPARSIIAGLVSAIEEIENVTRCMVYENDTNIVDEDGIPPHSIYCIVENGEDEDIANAIYKKKGPGCGTHGSEVVTLQDGDGHDFDIRFDRVQYVDIDARITISPRAGYSQNVPTKIQEAIVEYLDDFTIGRDLTISVLWMVAQQINTDPTNPSFSVTSVKAARHGETLGMSDVPIALNETVRGRVSYIQVVVE